MLPSVSGGGGGGKKPHVGAFSQEGGKAGKTERSSSKELGAVKAVKEEGGGPAATEGKAGKTLEERSKSMGELSAVSTRESRAGSEDSFGSTVSAGKVRIFRLLGDGEKTPGEAGRTKAQIQRFADADAIEKEMMSKTDKERRQAGFEHMTDSSGSPLMSFVLDPIALFTKSGDGKLLGLLANCRYLAVGHAKPEKTLVPMKAQRNQRSETEVLVFPKGGTVQGEVDFYENPFFGVKTPEEAKARWEEFKAGKRNGTVQPLEARDRERADSGLHTTGDPTLRQVEFEQIYPGAGSGSSTSKEE